MTEQEIVEGVAYIKCRCGQCFQVVRDCEDGEYADWDEAATADEYARHECSGA